LYLATKKIKGRPRYFLRESYPSNGRILWRDLYDLGENPADYIIYPGGHSFYFEQNLIETLSGLGVPDVDRELEKVLLPFLHPDVRRIVLQMTRLSRRKRSWLSLEAMGRVQARLHLFDRRRFFWLRFGRMDSTKNLLRPQKFLNVLVDMSRDEIEHYFRALELRLKFREKKQYVYQALDLGRWFPGEAARLFPLGLDPEKLDEVFLAELCRLNQDPDFLDLPGDPALLSEYLVGYAVMWFDFEFAQRPPQSQFFEEFVRSRRAYRPLSPIAAAELTEALEVFDLTEAGWRSMSRDDLGRLYRRLAWSSHPDQGGDSAEFIKLNLAYQRLAEGK